MRCTATPTVVYAVFIVVACLDTTAYWVGCIGAVSICRDVYEKETNVTFKTVIQKGILDWQDMQYE